MRHQDRTTQIDLTFSLLLLIKRGQDVAKGWVTTWRKNVKIEILRHICNPSLPLLWLQVVTKLPPRYTFEVWEGNRTREASKAGCFNGVWAREGLKSVLLHGHCISIYKNKVAYNFTWNYVCSLKLYAHDLHQRRHCCILLRKHVVQVSSILLRSCDTKGGIRSF
jgi:hypothetical protein